MKLKKLLRHLHDSLNKSKKGSEKEQEEIDQLLKRLEHRRDQLHHRLANEKRTCKQKRMKIELKIIEAKLKKGKKRLRAISLS